MIRPPIVSKMASTGSHLSGADTGVDPNGAANNPSIVSNASTMGGK